MEQKQTVKGANEEVAAEQRAADILCKMMHSDGMLWPEFRVLGQTNTGEMRQATHSGNKFWPKAQRQKWYWNFLNRQNIDSIIAVRMIVIPLEHRNFKFYVDYVPYEDEYILAIDDIEKSYDERYKMIRFEKGMIPVLYAKNVYGRYLEYRKYAQSISSASKLYETNEWRQKV